MEMIFWLLAGVLAAWAIRTFNLLVRDKNRVLAAWSDIDIQLKRRHDLIPKLVDTVRAYATYEQARLEEITRLRGPESESDDPVERSRMEASLGRELERLLAVAESYPELKASAHFVALQREISHVEEQIQFARRYYNGAVRNLNVRIDSFPDLILARLFRYRPATYFELDRPATP